MDSKAERGLSGSGQNTFHRGPRKRPVTVGALDSGLKIGLAVDRQEPENPHGLILAEPSGTDQLHKKGRGLGGDLLETLAEELLFAAQLRSGTAWRGGGAL